MKVGEIMTKDPVCCVLTDTAQHVARMMRDEDIGAVPVVQDQHSRKLIGMITDRDLCCSVIADGRDPKITTVVNLISAGPFSCRDSDDLEQCERAMQQHRVRRIPVVDSEV